MSGESNNISRRSLLTATASVASAIGLSRPSAVLAATAQRKVTESVPFYGAHQAGIVTEQQHHTYFAAFDVTATKKSDLIALFKTWTEASARLTAGLPVESATNGYDTSQQLIDSGETVGLSPERLTLTFGFGPELFVKDGNDRFGLRAHQPEALATLPVFPGDKLIESKCGGDLSVQACADDPQVAFHAVRQLARLADGVAQIRWVQSGFLPAPEDDTTPRNLMGFKDGTQQPQTFDGVVWAGDEGPDWMRAGSYLVVRKIRIALEHWDRTPVDFQEETIGRRKQSGAPLGAKREFDPLDLAAVDSEGKRVIADTAHVRLASAASNGGAQILRRAFSFNDGVNFTAERWPPWRQGLEYDAGLLFISYQRDPRSGFMKIFERMSKVDMLNQFTTHIGSGVFACPPGVAEGGFIGERLFHEA